MTTKITASSSKHEEIAAFKAIAASFPQGTYLASFFSKEMVEWFAAKAHDDMSTDLMHDFEWMREQKVNAEALIRQADESHAKEIGAMEREMAKVREDADETTRRVNAEAQMEADTASARLTAAHELNDKLIAETERLGDVQTRLQAEIAELQAKLDNARALASAAWLDDTMITPAGLRDAIR